MKSSFALVLTVLLIAVPGLAQKTTVDYDEDADFTTMSTYSWQVGTPIPNQLMDQRVIAAVDYHLSMLGYVKTDGTPDVYVTYHAATQEQQSISTTGYGYGGGRRYRRHGGGMASSTSRVHTYVKGTLVVDIWDAAEKSLMWRGTSTDTLSDKPEKNEKKINKGMGSCSRTSLQKKIKSTTARGGGRLS